MNVVMQFVSLAGALLILGAFYALQRRWWTGHGRLYLWANLIGGSLLLIVAAYDRRVGFMVLEGAWAAIALRSLVRRGPSNGTADRPLPY